MKILKQDKNYNCGAYALHFLLDFYGIHKTIEEIEYNLGTDNENGTSHVAIEKTINSFGLQYTSFNNGEIQDVKWFLPAIINYQWDGDGHYSIVLGTKDSCFIIYNPGTGEIERLEHDYLKKNWTSKRYGDGWYLGINSNLT